MLKWVTGILQARNSNFKVRCLPYFYLAGTTKSGTTDLFDALIRHPQIVPPACKENFYWTRARIEGTCTHYILVISSFEDYIHAGRSPGNITAKTRLLKIKLVHVGS